MVVLVNILHHITHRSICYSPNYRYSIRVFYMSKESSLFINWYHLMKNITSVSSASRNSAARSFTCSECTNDAVVSLGYLADHLAWAVMPWLIYLLLVWLIDNLRLVQFAFAMIEIKDESAISAERCQVLSAEEKREKLTFREWISTLRVESMASGSTRSYPANLRSRFVAITLHPHPCRPSYW